MELIFFCSLLIRNKKLLFITGVNISQQWTFAILATIGVCIGNIVRIILSITIVNMALPTTGSAIQGDDTCGDSNSTISQNNTSFNLINNSTTNEERYDWDEYTQV